MNSTKNNNGCKKVTKAAATPLPPSPAFESKKPKKLTIEVTSSVTLDFDAWRGFSHTKATDYDDVDEYETALKAEWDMLLSESHGKLEWEDDDDGPDDDMIKLMLEDYDYCAPDPPPKMTAREKAIIAKYQAKMDALLAFQNREKNYFKEPTTVCGEIPTNYAILRNHIVNNPISKQDLAVILYNIHRQGGDFDIGGIMTEIDLKVSGVYRDTSEDGYAAAEAE